MQGRRYDRILQGVASGQRRVDRRGVSAVGRLRRAVDTAWRAEQKRFDVGRRVELRTAAVRRPSERLRADGSFCVGGPERADGRATRTNADAARRADDAPEQIGARCPVGAIGGDEVVYGKPREDECRAGRLTLKLRDGAEVDLEIDVLA